MSELLFYVLIFIVAVGYSSAGFGGASGYLLVMSFFHIPSQVMSSVALTLNAIVSTISFWNYFRAGHFRPRLLIPFLVTSIPASFLGGMVTLDEQTYFMLLYAVLTYLALRMLLFPVISERPDWKARPFPLGVALMGGALIGLLSGMVGIGGGIFLSPLIILAGWGTSKQAAASSGAFIAINSISGLVGRMANGTFSFGAFGFPMLIVGAIGALIGGQIGAQKLSGAGVRRALGIGLMVAVGVYWSRYL
ncbi:MAG: sulfite exporter TauE/SafE family protein [Anaerolineales bacterium]